MFRLYKLVRDLVDGVEEIRELAFDADIEWKNRRPPLNIELVCENEQADMSIKYRFNLFMSNGYFTVKCKNGLPGSLVASAESYCQKINRALWGNKTTRIISLYCIRDEGESRQYFCEHFNAVENYFIDHYQSESASSNDKILQCFDALRKSMRLPQRHQIYSLQTDQRPALLKIKQKKTKEMMHMRHEKADRDLLKEKLENMVECPITGEIFKEPVMTDSGKTYEGEYIRQWMAKNKHDPLTGKEIKNLRPHLRMKRLAEQLPFILEELEKGIFRKLMSILWCPVSGASFEYPVVTMDGYTYELKAISEVPKCLYNPIKGTKLVKDYAIYDLISFLKQRAALDYSIINFIKFNQTFELFFIKLSMFNDRKDLHAMMLTCMSFYRVIKDYFTPYDIHIKTLSMNTFGLSVCAMDTVEDLVEKAWKTQNITVSINKNTFFCFAGKRLEDKIPIKDYRVQQEATIFLINK